MSGFITVGYFLVTLFFGIFLLLLWLRMFLRFYKVSALHPISQMVNRFTDPIIKPVSDRLPAKMAKISPYDWPCLALIIVVELVKFIILGLLIYKQMLPLSYLILFTIADLIIQPCNLLFYLLLIRVVMSWVNPNWKHPLADVIRTVTDPLLEFVRQILPETSGFDFSPFLILVILKVITLFLTASLPLRLV